MTQKMEENCTKIFQIAMINLYVSSEKYQEIKNALIYVITYDD